MRPDAPFNALNTTLGASAQAFAGVQGAMALFGAESEDLQKTLIKVQGAMALAEGFKAIDGLTDGFAQLNLVIKQNPLIAGAAVFVAATTAIAALTIGLDENREAQQRLNDINKKAFDSTISETVEMKRLLKVYNDKKTTDTERLKIQKTLVSKWPEYFGQISTERVETEKVNGAITKYIDLLKFKAQAQAEQEMYVEALKKQYAIEQQIQSLGGATAIAAAAARVGVAENAVAINVQLAKTKVEVAGLEGLYNKLATAAKTAEDAQISAFGTNITEPIDKATKKVKEYTAALPKAPKSKVDMTPLSAGEDLGNPFERKASTPQTNFSPIEGGMYEPSAPSQPAGTTINADKLIDPEKLAESKKAMLEMEALSQQISSSMVSAFSAIGDEMAASLDTGNKAMDRFAGAMIKTVTEIIGMLVAQAVGNAIVGGTQAGTATGPAAPFTTPAFIATAVGGVMAAFAAIPKFETGGVVGGSSYHGDKILARVNSGELILNTGQQRAVLNAMGNSNMVMAETKISGRDLAIVLKKYNQDISRG